MKCLMKYLLTLRFSVGVKTVTLLITALNIVSLNFECIMKSIELLVRCGIPQK